MAICSFVDRDMLMRHFGHGVGHLQYRTRRPQDSDARFESGTTVNASAESVLDDDTGRDVEVDIDLEEEGELEGDLELESDIDSDSASTAESDVESEVSKDSSNDSDGYASF